MKKDKYKKTLAKNQVCEIFQMRDIGKNSLPKFKKSFVWKRHVGVPFRNTNSWVARDVTENQTKKLSILLSFYFHEVLQYLNIFYINKFLVRKGSSFCERTLEFPGFCVTRHLAGGRESSYVG